jgi:hypothetical protein
MHADRVIGYWCPPRYLLSDLLELAGYEPGEASAVAITGMQTDPSQASSARPCARGPLKPWPRLTVDRMCACGGPCLAWLGAGMFAALCSVCTCEPAQS